MFLERISLFRNTTPAYYRTCNLSSLFIRMP